MDFWFIPVLFALISRKKGGDNMAKIDSAYSYYLNTYGSSAVSRYDTHKKSELRNTYNRIVKLNKESPLYKISSSGDVKKFAIDIKEIPDGSRTSRLPSQKARMDCGVISRKKLRFQVTKILLPPNMSETGTMRRTPTAFPSR